MSTELAAWLRRQAEADKAAAAAATPGPWEFEGDDPADDELYSIHDEDLLPTVAWTRHRNVANGQHMARHDPLTETARADALLRILNGYDHILETTGSPPARRITPWLPPDVEWEIRTREYRNARQYLVIVEPVVRVLAAGYQHRHGYLQEWMP